ncbi:hypothetical protein SUGI_0475720 [Cryptomeria japonica]|uniref:UPF0548 protein At2g17695 n=1 Tax=Cryptomeria japonica TaxID=3369 RepID=UPI002408B306|nr:UPF0548 protein At2g17695 [Cryptomeria japonica]GLJ24874.1 hypothetical protein SUGI_0475720 [Cryptomeria japonica]
MLFISWLARPSSEYQASCLKHILPESFNYEEKHRNATEKAPFSNQFSEELGKDGYTLSHSRVRIGSGLQAYQKGKQLLNKWGHFQLRWAWVESSTCIKVGQKFCVCSQELVPWILMPLQILYVNDHKSSNDIHPSPSYNTVGLRNVPNIPNLKAIYCFGSGTLQGHLLAGEERFSVELDEDDNVWYEILSFSRPAHVLSFVAQPYVCLKQKIFAQQSTQAMLKAISERGV